MSTEKNNQNFFKKIEKKKSFHMIDIDIICSKKIERLNNKKWCRYMQKWHTWYRVVQAVSW